MVMKKFFFIFTNILIFINISIILNAQTDESKIQIIKENFKEINKITNWTTTKSIELTESTEGGELIACYDKSELKKLIVLIYGETYKQVEEYYLLKNKLSFVYHKFYKYNRPIYWDSTAMKDNKDDQVFEIEKSTIDEQRFYFDSDKMIQWINEKNTKVNSTEQIFKDKEIEIAKDFRALIEKVKN